MTDCRTHDVMRDLIKYFPQNLLQLSKLQLRLDSQLYLLSKEEALVDENDSDPSLVLKESYAIKKGPVMINVVGSWSRSRGLTITGRPSMVTMLHMEVNLSKYLPEPDVWIRRRDLRVRNETRSKYFGQNQMHSES